MNRIRLSIVYSSYSIIIPKYRVLIIIYRVLVVQQKKYIEFHTAGHAKVREYTSDVRRHGKHIDDWGKAEWHQEMAEVEVFVFIPQLLKVALKKSFLHIVAFNLIIFDECHHAFGKTPMANICEMIQSTPLHMRPLIFGMTGSPLPCKKVPTYILTLPCV